MAEKLIKGLRDYILNVEVRVSARPITPKTDPKKRPPYEKNKTVIIGKKTSHFAGTTATLSSQIDKALEVVASGAMMSNPDFTPPKASIDPVVAFSHEAAVVSGVVVHNNLETAVLFFYGKTQSSEESEHAIESPITGAALEDPTVGVSAELTGLDPETTYYVRIAVENDDGAYITEPVAFTTEAVP